MRSLAAAWEIDTISRKDTMDTWDEAKLREVVLSKHGNPRTTTDVRFPQSLASLSPHRILRSMSDCLQKFYRGNRDTKVHSSTGNGPTHLFTPLMQIRLVLAMSKWRSLPIPARTSCRVCTEITAQSCGSSREGKHDHTGRVFRGRGALYLKLRLIFPSYGLTIPLP